jgi:hypothetical protein
MQSFSYVTFLQVAKIFPNVACPTPPVLSFSQSYLSLAEIGRNISPLQWFQSFSWGANPSPTQMRLPKARRKLRPARAKAIQAERKRISPEQLTKTVPGRDWRQIASQFQWLHGAGGVLILGHYHGACFIDSRPFLEMVFAFPAAAIVQDTGYAFVTLA